MYCKHLRVRTKKGQKYLYCVELRQVIILTNCQKCLKTQPRAYKPIKKVSKKRILVKKDIYSLVNERDKNKCRLCGKTNIELHHIYYRSERKDLINEPLNCIMLCTSCHQLVHSDKHYWQQKLLKMNGVENLWTK